ATADRGYGDRRRPRGYAARRRPAALGAVARWRQASRSLLCRRGAEDRLQHLVGIVAVDHRAQEAPHGFRVRRAHLLERAVDAPGLQARELADQRFALRRGIEQALPAIVVAGL